MDKSKYYQRSELSGNNGVSCNCGCNSHGDCNSLLKKILAVDFSLQETVLYLDAYPHCSDALNYYHQLKELREKLVSEYCSKCGALTNLSNESKTEWIWIRSPWPWEADANK